jgi:Tfp pilus assembly PilM family ATPase
MLRFEKVRPPVRQVVAVDGGSRRFKLLLAESDFGRVRILKQELIDLPAEGLISPGEIKTHLHEVLEKWGDPPLALVLPEHLSTSQLLDLPQVPESEVDKLIAEESIKLSGVSQSRIVHDFARTDSNLDNRQQFWVTLCQEGEIRERIARLGIEQDDLCEVTTTGNALISAYCAAAPNSARSILVHLGAQTTILVIVLRGQPAFAASFQMGSDFFTRALARQRNCSDEEAEQLKRTRNLLAGPDLSVDFRGAVEGWVAELKRQLSEWFRQHAAEAAANPAFELIASGGGFDQPGLLDYLRSQAEMPMRPWPATEPETSAPAKHFEIAYGIARQALGHVPTPISLLPEDYRQAWQRRLARQRLDLASAVLLFICILVLALGTWRKLQLYDSKEALLEKVQAGQAAVDANDSFTADLMTEYENLRPVLAAQQATVDTLKTVSLLQQSRSNRAFWYVLLADQSTYFSQPMALQATNRPAKTNLLTASIETPRLQPLAARPSPSLTNNFPARPGFIAELCVPGDAEASRQVLSELVYALKQERLFSKVDLLSDDLRRNLADPKVCITDRDFVLALDFSQTDFQQPIRWRRIPTPGTPRVTPRPLRPGWNNSDPAGSPGANPR